MLRNPLRLSPSGFSFKRVVRLGTRFVLMISIPMTFVACHSAPKSDSIQRGTGESKNPVASAGAQLIMYTGSSEKTVTAQAVTSIGDNSMARFSEDGTGVIFVSGGRPSHRNKQVYEISLAQMKERRLTFNDGEDLNPLFINAGRQILYSSSTDEIKEEPAALERILKSYYPEGLKSNRPSTAPLDPSEIYVQTLDGQVRERLTKVPGYDGEPAPHPDGKRIVFTSSRDGNPNLYLLGNNSTQRLTRGAFADRGAQFSPDGKSLVWSRHTPAFASAQIILSDENGRFRNAIPLTPQGAIDLHPTWHPNGNEIVFSSNRGGRFYNLYSIDRSGKCFKRLTQAVSDQLNPSFSPDGQRLLFTSVQGGRHQIYIMDYQPPNACQ